MAFTVSSSAFAQGRDIPSTFTCDREDIAPPLEWSDVPRGTRSFALIMDDPDAPGGVFTHWLIYDIPGTARTLADPSTARTLKNDFGRQGYGGPCPPRGRGPHRYNFTLYAVDVAALDVRGATRKALEQALEGHALARAVLTGQFERRRAGAVV